MNNNENEIDFSNFSSQDGKLPEEISRAIDHANNIRKSKEIASSIANFLYIAKECIDQLDSRIFKNKEKLEDQEPHYSNYADVIQKLIHRELEGLDGFCEKDFALHYKKESRDRVLTKIRALNDPYTILGFEYVVDRMLDKEKIPS